MDGRGVETSLEFDICKAFIDGTVERLKATKARNPDQYEYAAIISDINGTLDSFDELDNFLADAARFGLTVRLMSGHVDNGIRGYALTEQFIKQGVLDAPDGEPMRADSLKDGHFIAKPVAKGALLPAFAVDDQQSVLVPLHYEPSEMVPRVEDLADYPHLQGLEEAELDFLLAWEKIGANPDADIMKKQLLEPWVALG